MILIIGAGGMAKDIWSYLFAPSCMFYSERIEPFDIYRGNQVIHSLDQAKDIQVVYYGIGDSKTRERLWQADKMAPILVRGSIGSNVWLSEGTIICPGVQISPDVKIGKGCIVNVNATIGHDTVIGDFVTIAPGVNISGNVTIGHGAMIGTGACIRERVTIGKYAKIGMGAVILKDVPSEEVYVGNPGRRL
jgi:sugar O-acyltransferase (sialic acid O-acetyltransferase NeuD family)